MLTGLFRDVLSRHFITLKNIEEPSLQQLLWRDDARTGILIESITRWRGDLIGKRPAIIISENGRRNLRKGIGDQAGTTEQGHERYQTFWVGSHTLFCIHGPGAGAGLLATEVQREITQFAPVIVAELGLYRLQVTEVGKVFEIAEARDNFAIPVNIGWAYDEQWVVRRESLKLADLTLAALLNL